MKNDLSPRERGIYLDGVADGIILMNMSEDRPQFLEARRRIRGQRKEKTE